MISITYKYQPNHAINDGSHGITDDLYIELQADATDKYLKVFKRIFVLTNHEEHYHMMMA
jgi:wobble nucleotide-excising tRNase